MAGKKRKPVSEAEVTGLKYLKRIASLLKRLRPVGCARDRAGNRNLFFDQYCGLMLLYMFNPIVTSLRGMQQTSQLKKVQRLLGCGRASLGSLSEADRRRHDIVLVTNLLDVPAEIIALIYRCRWMIELYFRFLKHVLGCRKLLSHCDNGIEIQTYCAIIACLLISLVTGRKPTPRTYEMLCFYFQGLADEEELLAHLNRLPPHDTAGV